MQPEPEDARTLIRCPACGSEHVTHVIDYEGRGPMDEALTTFTCQACDHTWQTKGGRMTPATVDETAKCLNDLTLYGMAFVDGKGRRVHPSTAIFDEDGLHDSVGRPLYKPTPIVFP